MLTHSTRRWLAGLGVAGAFVAASAGPAGAAAPAPEYGLYFQNVTVAPDSPGVVASAQLYSSAPAVLNEVTVRYDYRSLTGKVTLAGGTGNDCAPDGAGVLTCVKHFPLVVDEVFGGSLDEVLIVPTEKAAVGDAGELKISVKSADKAVASFTSRIQVGEGVDLAGGPDTRVKAAPGGAFEVPLVVRNVGKTDVKGVVALFDTDYGIRTKERFENCYYEEDFLFACEFDQTIAAGTGGTTTINYEVAKDAYAPGTQGGGIWLLTPGDLADLNDVREKAGAKAARKGAGKKLSLAPLAGARGARALQTDTDPSNNHSSVRVEVTGKNGADLEAVGATLTGKKGAVLTAALGFRNNGPATLERIRDEADVTFVDVTVPNGTTAVEVPLECAPRTGNDAEWDEAGTPGAAGYRCYSGPFAPAGEELTGEFKFRIDTVIANATGTVKVNVPCKCDGGFYADLKPANDTAKILVNAGGTGGGNGGGDNGDGGGLPVTGQSTGLIAGLGALLLAAGVGGYLVAKRRRTRFVA
ncbi:LPXTG cell wall anchor domain-containing protein [Micromonospora sp. LAH09]|uniref:LPXTG cell wall anchor domain-containing protein n=1 Tax=Micromonospora cabrerizensis TaxID=2911213 RepID=UPI001EE87D5B|nr:LPXTG cell wall anchor domain-containing protein [Micromonospora cabrerizensis]MCG5467723.1 LPXTG cell wall anchor domain-containing protein [Micromonospora cabrerizensis]